MIEFYNFGRIVIDGKEYTSDVIIYPGHVDSSWWRKEGHRLQVVDIDKAIAEKPEILIIGTGASGLMEVSKEVESYITSKGIRLMVDTTKKACQAYNRLSQSSKTIAALHLTC
jgi:hypothetical protein